MPLGKHDPLEPSFSVMYLIYVDRDAACSVFHIAELWVWISSWDDCNIVILALVITGMESIKT